MAGSASFTVIIPAHNEDAVIARCLTAMLADAPSDHGMEIIVAANGCSDRTVNVAQAAAPDAIIMTLPAKSKTAAINAANRMAGQCPRIYVDADVECNYTTLSGLADRLRAPGVMAAAPAIRMRLNNCDPLVRAYYRAWLRQPYAKAGKGGAGCYGLSAQALAEVGDFPPITGDDIWIHTRFPDKLTRYVTSDGSGRDIFAIVHPPRTAWQHIKVEARRRAGTDEVRRLYPNRYFVNATGSGGFLAGLKSGTRVGDLVIFFALKLCARLLAKWRDLRGQNMVWTRDLSTREA